MSIYTKKNKHGGFTIVELMIATAILSIILTLVTVMMIRIGDLYYKGISQTIVQDNVRTITDDVSQHLQLNDQSPTTATSGSTQAYCINTTRYTYVLNNQIGTNGYIHILWRDTIPNNQSCTTANLAASNPSKRTHGTNGTELLANESMLTYFCIDGEDSSGNPESGCTPGNSPFNVSVAIAYGNALLTSSPPLLSGSGLSAACNGQTGDQYCATAHLTTTVAQRIL